MKIHKYKKLRENTKGLSNSEQEVAVLIDIFSNTGNLMKKISEDRKVGEYVEKGFFNAFSDVSQDIQKLIV